jgi:ectoine hydroxylase-related dioxygenase (phytanoyl-CoA dioxygenase family)
MQWKIYRSGEFMEMNIEAHMKAIAEKGYTVIPGQIDAEMLARLNAAADRAIQAVDSAMLSGVKPTHTEINPYVHAVRCFYCWDRSCRELLEHDTVQALSQAVLGDARLWDMSILEARPMPGDAELGPFDWHRDFPMSIDDEGQSYLWVFVCLTDTTADNGATWVIPASHRDASIPQPKPGAVSDTPPPTAVQLTACAGDIIAFNPVMLHKVGENRSLAYRRLALIGLCRAGRSPLLNHWAIAAYSVQREASDRLRRLLYTNVPKLDEVWDVLPDGWPSATKWNFLKRNFWKFYHRKSTVLSRARHLWGRQLDGKQQS